MNITENDLRTGLAAAVLLLAGVLLLVLSEAGAPGWPSTLAQHVGSFIIASVVLALVWQYWQAQGFYKQLFDKAQIAESLRRARVSGFFTTFHGGVPWEEMFTNCRSLNILFAYGATWRNAHQHQLETFLNQADAELKVVLPDPDDEVVMAEMAQRFGYMPLELQRRIQEALDFFRNLGDRLPGEVEVYFLARSLTFTLYRFTTKAVFTTYRHTPGRGSVITLVGDREGELYDWIRSEWYGILEKGRDEGLVRQAYPVAAD